MGNGLLVWFGELTYLISQNKSVRLFSDFFLDNAKDQKINLMHSHNFLKSEPISIHKSLILLPLPSYLFGSCIISRNMVNGNQSFSRRGILNLMVVFTCQYCLAYYSSFLSILLLRRMCSLCILLRVHFIVVELSIVHVILSLW